MQLSFRASLIARAVPAPVKLGFDRARARELQWLFTNARIAPRVARARAGQLLRLRSKRSGVQRARAALGHPAAADAREYAQQLDPRRAADAASSAPAPATRCATGVPSATRRWPTTRRVSTACASSCAAARRSSSARRARRSRQAAQSPLINQIGRDTLPQLLALLARATALVAPDSGPGAHGDDGRHARSSACTRRPIPARSGPYLSRRWCVNAYRGGGAALPRHAARAAALDGEDRGARRDGPDHASSRSPRSSTSC